VLYTSGPNEGDIEFEAVDVDKGKDVCRDSDMKDSPEKDSDTVMAEIIVGTLYNDNVSDVCVDVVTNEAVVKGSFHRLF